MAKATSVFNAHAARYDEARRRLIPPFDLFYGTAIEAIELAGPEPGRVLDLGAGTGMFSAFVLDAYPSAHLTLFDAAPLMLERAKDSLDDERVEIVVGDMYREIPEGPWDAVISALAIHHMTDEGKRFVFGAAHDSLRPGGVFINAEHIFGPTETMDAEYRRWHEMSARQAGTDDDEWNRAVERMGHDHLSPLEDQLAWLREAGFEDVDCLFKQYGFAVMFGRRAE
ncbi:MAG TPA: methyltransferase domain-containing protein [Solirubrobacterales bacterium]|nr:methyltransferase domain-containing protein [Solirubrobacterales bacterium]